MSNHYYVSLQTLTSHKSKGKNETGKKMSDLAKFSFCILKDGHSDGGGGEGNVLAIHLHQAGEPA